MRTLAMRVIFMGKSLTLIKLILFFFTILVYCEFLHYYIVLLQCTWPTRLLSTDYGLINKKSLKVMVLADTHLLGFREGHWFDKLRREWQMERSFQTAMTLHNPAVVFVLGDLLDEGKWCSDSEFDHHIQRFHKMFRHSDTTKMHVVAGNHDIGFHFMITEAHKHRFEHSMSAPSVSTIHIHDITFILINSMALEGDRCKFCAEAEAQLSAITKSLNCAKTYNSAKACEIDPKYLPYSRPVLLQHFPMYRDSDSNCSLHVPDAAPKSQRFIPFRQRYDCLSKTASDQLLAWLDPRLIISAHTHHGCYRKHPGEIPEWTVGSFSWRYKAIPSFLMMVISADDFEVKQCFLPSEDTVFAIYVFGGTFILVSAFLKFTKLRTFLGNLKAS